MFWRQNWDEAEKQALPNELHAGKNKRKELEIQDQSNIEI